MEEYNELIKIKEKYNSVMELNTIKLSNCMMYCRLCCHISKQDSVLNKTIYNETHFK
jgi:hypothetical protein